MERRPRWGHAVHINGVVVRPLLRGSGQKLRQRVGVSIVSLNVVRKKKGRREATLVLRMVTTEASRAAGVRERERQGAGLMWDADRVGELSPARDACWGGRGVRVRMEGQ